MRKFEKGDWVMVDDNGSTDVTFQVGDKVRIKDTWILSRIDVEQGWLKDHVYTVIDTLNTTHIKLTGGPGPVEGQMCFADRFELIEKASGFFLDRIDQ